MNFKYKYFKTPVGYKRPLVRVTLRNGKKEIPILALIDSGADYNIFHSGLAEALDLNLDGISSKEMSGVSKGSNFKCYQQVVEIGLSNYWFSIPVYFSTGIADTGYSILGQQGFFDQFKSIRFDYGKGDIFLKK